jgi:hypothetical protein
MNFTSPASTLINIGTPLVRQFLIGAKHCAAIRSMLAVTTHSVYGISAAVSLRQPKLIFAKPSNG